MTHDSDTRNFQQPRTPCSNCDRIDPSSAYYKKYGSLYKSFSHSVAYHESSNPFSCYYYTQNVKHIQFDLTIEGKMHRDRSGYRKIWNRFSYYSHYFESCSLGMRLTKMVKIPHLLLLF
jgi:hypothetical protein